jgi:hypothetical protein
LSNYKIAKLSDQVYEIQNFITKDELDQVMQFVKSKDNLDWSNKDIQYDFWSDKVLYSSLINENPLFNNIYKRVCSLFSGNLEVTGINLQRYMMNDALGEHTDDHDGHRLNGDQVFYGVVIYYNDEYKGGELRYPDIGITHKPIAGSLLLHGGKILHGTLPVQDDTVRYISTMFVKHKLNEVVSLNRDVFGEDDGI